MNSQELRDRIADYCAVLDRLSADDFKRNGYWMDPPRHMAEYTSAKWCRIVRTDANGSSRSATAFICLQDGETRTLGRLKAGDVHMAASWSAPARHARSNVFAADLSKGSGAYGPNYLR